VAVTAITSELRDEIGLTTVQDYTNFAPGLSYSTSNDRLGMRGYVTRRDVFHALAERAQLRREKIFHSNERDG